MDFKYENFEFWKDKLVMKGMLFIAVSGAHAYGWHREDSDLDIRQVWFPDLAQMLSVFFRAKTKAWNEGKIDFVSYPIHNYLRLLAKGNGNIIENLFQEKLYQLEDRVKELQNIIREKLHKGILKHYEGYSISLAKDMDNPSRIKRYGLDKLLLCRYRVLFAGLILEERHEIVYNLEEQMKHRESENCMLLLKEYKSKKTKITGLRGDVMNELIDLHQELIDRIKQTDLPDSHIGTPKVELERWLVKYYQ